MKILHTVESYLPLQHGMQEVVNQLSERLVALGHDVTIATSYHQERATDTINGVHIRQFKISGNMVNGYNAEEEELSRYRRFVQESSFDVVVSFAAQQWATDLLLDLLPELDCVKVFVPTGFSALYNPDYNNYFHRMKKWLTYYDMNIFLSNDYRDINFARESGVNNFTIIPNGADEDEFGDLDFTDVCQRYRIRATDFVILLVGSHTGIKGHREAIEIFKKTFLRNAVLLIVGNEVNPSCYRRCRRQYNLLRYNPWYKLLRKRLLLLNISRQETVKLFKRADLFLFPSNLECSPIVLFEAMAAKTPFITSDCGNAQEIISWSDAGLLLPTKEIVKGLVKVDIDASAEILKQLYRDTALRAKLSANGYSAWQEKFTWRKIALEYEKLYLQLIERKKCNS